MKYNIDHYISKFTAIPDEAWRTGDYGSLDGPKCAFGHCGIWPFGCYKSSEEARQLSFIGYMAKMDIACINDGCDAGYQQSTPKARVLAALRDAGTRQGGQ